MLLNRLFGTTKAAPPTGTKVQISRGAIQHFFGRVHREGVDRTAVTSFGNTFAVEQQFTTHPELVVAALSKVEAGVLGGANESTALYDSAVTLGESFAAAGRPDAIGVVVIVTDGRDECSTRFGGDPTGAGIAYRRAVSRCYCPAVLTVVIGVGPDVNTAALESLARHGDMKMVSLANMSQLGGVLNDLGTQLTAGVEVDQFVSGRVVYTQARRVVRASVTPYDVAVLLDRSGSMAGRG